MGLIYGPFAVLLIAELPASASQTGGTPCRRRPRLTVDPRRYFESVGRSAAISQRRPVCVYLETTNRCNLLCTTCPRTYEELEPPADMSWELFTSIVDQIPSSSAPSCTVSASRCWSRYFPKMVRYLKDRGSYVLFNTNGTVLNDRNGRALIAAGLDELRVSLDAANAKSFRAIRGKDYFGRIIRNVRAFRNLQEREGQDRPRVSAWITELKETVAQLPEFVRVAAEIGVREVYLQRLVYFEQDFVGHARPDQALYEQMTAEDRPSSPRRPSLHIALASLSALPAPYRNRA